MEALADALGLTPAERVELLAAAGDQVQGFRVGDLLTEAARQLAYALSARLRREEEQRQIHDPVPLPVRWRPRSR